MDSLGGKRGPSTIWCTYVPQNAAKVPSWTHLREINMTWQSVLEVVIEVWGCVVSSPCQQIKSIKLFFKQNITVITAHHMSPSSFTHFWPVYLLENSSAHVECRKRVNYWDILCLNLEAGALLFQAEQDECEPEAPMGKKTSASQNKGRGASFSSGLGNTVFKPAGLTESDAAAHSSHACCF